MRRRDEARFTEFISMASPKLLASAWMLTGDTHAAEDLVQETLERVYVRWPRLQDGHNPLAYARRVLINLNTDRWRRRRNEVLTDATPEVAVTPSGDSSVDLVRALQKLPLRERQCVVLRHYQDLSEKQVADTLGVSLGTVKSSTSRGLAGLRSMLMGEESNV